MKYILISKLTEEENFNQKVPFSYNKLNYFSVGDSQILHSTDIYIYWSSISIKNDWKSILNWDEKPRSRFWSRDNEKKVTDCEFGIEIKGLILHDS